MQKFKLIGSVDSKPWFVLLSCLDPLISLPLLA